MNRGSTKLALALGGAALSLMVAGFFEVLEPHLGFGGVLLWVPVGLAYYLLVTWDRRRKRYTPPMSTP